MILAIETSCDDSAVALLDMKGNVVTSQISSQTELHEKYGGIVPEIASRKHLTTLPLVLRNVLSESHTDLADLEAVAVTYAPGLIGSLLVGVSYAKSLAWIAGVPLLPVDHLEGHLLAPFLDHKDLEFPYLALIASGGHTHLVIARDLGEYQLLGKTIDDAAGEAYDKVAKLLGFRYPGGPIVEKLADECDAPSINFPIPLKGKKTLNFSFSGIKTAVRNEAIKKGVFVEGKELISYDEFKELPENEQKVATRDIAASFQKTVVTIIMERFEEALEQYPLDRIAITGGVASNGGIRDGLRSLAERRKKRFFFPDRRNCTDNAAMIGYTALQYYLRGKVNQEGYMRLNAASKSPLGLMNVKW